jgi:hypothetical protein
MRGQTQGASSGFSKPFLQSGVSGLGSAGSTGIYPSTRGVGQSTSQNWLGNGAQTGQEGQGTHTKNGSQTMTQVSTGLTTQTSP